MTFFGSILFPSYPTRAEFLGEKDKISQEEEKVQRAFSFMDNNGDGSGKLWNNEISLFWSGSSPRRRCFLSVSASARPRWTPSLRGMIRIGMEDYQNRWISKGP